MKAQFMNIEPNISGSTVHWKLEPPWEDWDGETHEWVVTSLINWEDEFECLMFPSNEKGDIVSHNELVQGSFRGNHGHEYSISRIGYTPNMVK